ncbi:MAG: YncE family protein, partial [Tepidiformaceae bacterium]
LSPDGTRAFVGVYTRGGSFLEVFHTRNGFERSIPVGDRPFDVVMDPSGSTVYTIDHDAYTLTAIDTQTWEPRTIEVAPLGRGAFDKPHYGVVANGELLLPFQGRTVLAINVATGATREMALTADTHQHGLAVSPDGKSVAIVGTGPAGEAAGGPSLTILSLADGSERIIPLARPHEMVAFSLDGSEAYLTGGYLLDGGWEGVTVVDLESGATREIVVPARPLGIYVLGPQ